MNNIEELVVKANNGDKDASYDLGFIYSEGVLVLEIIKFHMIGI